MDIDELTRLNVRSWRIDHDISQQDLANIAGVSRKTIGQYERGEVRWSEAVLIKLIDELAPLSVDMLTYPYGPRARVDRQYRQLRNALFAANTQQGADTKDTN